MICVCLLLLATYEYEQISFLDYTENEIDLYTLVSSGCENKVYAYI